jgi:hypothetical protein
VGHYTTTLNPNDNMYLGSPYSITPEERLDRKVKQKEYAKKITKMIRNREYTVGSLRERITFRIVSVLPSKDNLGINDYRLNVEISNIEYYMGYCNSWENGLPSVGDRVSHNDMNKYKYWIEGELKIFLEIFGFSSNWNKDGSAIINYETPKVINRK